MYELIPEELKFEEMSPLPHVGGHDHLSLEAVGENGSRLLRHTPNVQKIKIGLFRLIHGGFPSHPCFGVLSQIARLDDCDLAAEFDLVVVVVSRTLLTVACKSMSN